MSYKILSLDGGGSWALIQASVLQDLYGDISGHEILRKFDMVIANSGGALVLACLCNDMEPGEIISIFKNDTERKKIFSRLQFHERNLLSHIRAIFKNFAVGSKYHAERKKEGLMEVLQEHDKNFRSGILPPIIKTPLSKLPKIIGKEDLQIIIAGFDYFKERVNFFRSNEKSKTDKFSKYYEISLGDAIHASSNAPVNYFNEYAKVEMECKTPEESKEKKINWYWDGGVAGFNNPVLAGLIEAMTNFENKPLEDFKILSIGSGQKGKAIIVDQKHSEGNPRIKNIYEKNKDKPYVLSDDSREFKLEISKLAQSILSDPPDSATFMAYSILNRQLQNDANIVRINPCITPELNKVTNEYILPEVFRNEPENFMSVLNLDMDATEDKEVERIVDVAAKFIVNEEGKACLPNQLIRGDSSGTFKLGHSTYRQAKKRWREIEGEKTGEDTVF